MELCCALHYGSGCNLLLKFGKRKLNRDRGELKEMGEEKEEEKRMTSEIKVRL